MSLSSLYKFVRFVADRMSFNASRRIARSAELIAAVGAG